MQNKREVNLMANLNVDLPQKKPKKEEVIQIEKRESIDLRAQYEDTGSSLDDSMLDELIKEEEKLTETLIKTNDQAVAQITSGNLKEGLLNLERIEKILEYAASSGQTVDRNLVIVSLYNIACIFQSMWVLDKCSKYIDAVIFNLTLSIKQDDQAFQSQITKANTQQVHIYRSVKLKKLQFLVRVFLQHCAVLSQLSKHDEAYEFALRAQKAMLAIMTECSSYCKEMKAKVEHTNPNRTGADRTMSILNSSNSANTSIFKDDVPYLKFLLEYAIPFLEDFIKTTSEFSGNQTNNILAATKKSLFNWKNNPENNEKYLRKEFKKANIQNDVIDDARSLLGVRQTPEWLANLNIGSVMHMKPMKYKEYAHKRDLVTEITKDSLHEKAIFQSLVYFTTATEMRFQEITKEQESEDDLAHKSPTHFEQKLKEALKNSEAYHLKAIEIVCRYVSGPCPYVNHLISSYQKHYHQDLETIPEESFISANEAHSTNEKEPKNTILEKINAKIEHNKRLSQPETNKKTLIPEKNNSHSRQTSDHAQRKLDFERLKTQERKSPSFLSGISIGEEEPKVFKHSLSTTSMNFSNFVPSKQRSPTAAQSFSNKQPRSILASSLITRTEPSPKKSTSQRPILVPNLNLGSATHQGTQPKKTSKPLEKAYASANLGGGYKTDRVQKKHDVHEFNTERSPRENKELSSSINVYFYKNFNKFIQNLYIQDEKNIQMQMQAAKKEDKLVNNPYHKEIVAMSLKRQANKKPTTAGPKIVTTSSNISGRISNIYQKPLVVNGDRAEIKNSDELVSKYIQEGTVSSRANKLLKSVSLKTMQNNLNSNQIYKNKEKLGSFKF